MKNMVLIKRIMICVGVSFLLVWPIRNAILGRLQGTFKAKRIPEEYISFKNFVFEQKDFFRIFWLPKRQRFGYWSNFHPSIDAEEFFTENECRKPFCSLGVSMPDKWGKKCFPNDRCHVRELSYFLNPQTAETLSQMAVKYVVVPFDSEEEIFIAERKYNSQQREEVEEFLDTVPWLKKVEVAEDMTVYELPEFKDHFFVAGKITPKIEWKMINSAKYKVQVKNANQPFKLIFSETYNDLWQVKIGDEVINSQPHFELLNSFPIDKTGDFEMTVEFTAQKYVYLGGVVSLLTLLLAIGALILPMSPKQSIIK